MTEDKRIYNKKYNFEEFSMGEYIHDLHSYPAMMMPLIARTFIKEHKTKDMIILDPYMGSGTSLLEGIVEDAAEVIGFDLNPLAILIATAKTTKYNLDSLHQEIEQFEEKLLSIKDYEVPQFTILESWFKQEQIISLAKLKEAIDLIEDEKNKLFFTLILSETIRDVSLTRNGEFKLYKIPVEKREAFNPDVYLVFMDKLRKKYHKLETFYRQTGFSDKKTKVVIHHKSLEEGDLLDKSVDLVVTSPPYGDSHTTVAYGQFSRLSNEWLGHENAVHIDRNLMGGGAVANNLGAFGISELDDAISEIEVAETNSKTKRLPYVQSFYKDYEDSIKTVARTVKKGGYVLYLVGNRRVRDVELPTDIITARMFEKYSFVHEKTIVRDILNKRMPKKTSPTNKAGDKVSTMKHEYLVILRKK